MLFLYIDDDEEATVGVAPVANLEVNCVGNLNDGEFVLLLLFVSYLTFISAIAQ